MAPLASVWKVMPYFARFHYDILGAPDKRALRNANEMEYGAMKNVL